MPQCQAIYCTNKSGSGKSFFQFPKLEKGIEERKLCKKWIDNLKNGKLRIETFRAHRGMVVCEDHFTEDCFSGSFSSTVAAALNFSHKRKSLKKDSVPTVIGSKAGSSDIVGIVSAQKSADSLNIKRKKAQTKMPKKKRINICLPKKGFWKKTISDEKGPENKLTKSITEQQNNVYEMGKKNGSRRGRIGRRPKKIKKTASRERPDTRWEMDTLLMECDSVPDSELDCYKNETVKLESNGCSTNEERESDSLQMECDSVPHSYKNETVKLKSNGSSTSEERIDTKLQTESVKSTKSMNISSIHGIPVNMPFSMKYSIPDIDEIFESKVYIIVELASVASRQVKQMKPTKIDVTGVLKKVPMGNNISELYECRKNLSNVNVVNGKERSNHSTEVGAEKFNKSGDNERKRKRINISPCEVKQSSGRGSFLDADVISDNIKIDISSVRQLKDWSDCQDAEAISDHIKIDMSSVRQLKGWSDCQDAEAVSDHIRIDTSLVRQMKDWSDCQAEENHKYTTVRMVRTKRKRSHDLSDFEHAEKVLKGNVNTPISNTQTKRERIENNSKDFSNKYDDTNCTGSDSIIYKSILNIKTKQNDEPVISSGFVSNDYHGENNFPDTNSTTVTDPKLNSDMISNRDDVRTLNGDTIKSEPDSTLYESLLNIKTEQDDEPVLSSGFVPNDYHGENNFPDTNSTTVTDPKLNSDVISNRDDVRTLNGDTIKSEPDSSLYESLLNIKTEQDDEPVLSSGFVPNDYHGENNFAGTNSATVTDPKWNSDVISNRDDVRTLNGDTIKSEPDSTLYESLLNVKTEQDDESVLSSGFVPNDYHGENNFADTNSTTVTDPKWNSDGISNIDDVRALHGDNIKSEPDSTLYESVLNIKTEQDDESVLPSCIRETPGEVEEQHDDSPSSKTKKVILCYRYAREKEQDPECTVRTPKIDIGYLDIGKGEACYEFYDSIAKKRELEEIQRASKVNQ